MATKRDPTTRDPSTSDATGANPAAARKGAKVPARSAASPASGETVVAGVKADLETIGPVDGGRALAASAFALAAEMDDPGVSATAKSMCARALTETMDRLRALVPAEQENDALDDLAARRTARLSRGSAS